MDEPQVTTALAEPLPVEYGITEIDIARARARYRALNADSSAGYEEVRAAIAHLRTTRTSIEKRRVELKAAALEHGRRVDSVAKQLTTLIVDIEAPLLAKKAAVDDERERLKREAERAELVALETKLRAEREVENARLREEAARIAQERAAHETERQRVQAEQRAAQARIDADRRALDEQRQAMEAQQRAAARAEAERQRLVRIEAEGKAQAERDRLAALQAEAAAVLEAARLEFMRPDIDKVHAWAAEIRELAGRAPALESEEAAGAIGWSVGRLEFVAVALDKFKAEKAA